MQYYYFRQKKVATIAFRNGSTAISIPQKIKKFIGNFDAKSSTFIKSYYG
jgi:hypothetical protein